MIDAVYQHQDGYKFNQMYKSAKRFLASVGKQRNAVFLNAVDYSLQEVIYPSTLPDYRYRIVNRI